MTPYEIAQKQLTGGASTTNDVAGTGYTGIMENINDYINPYYENVIDTALGRMRDERDMNLNRAGDAMQANGSFAGNRRALLEAEIMDNHERAVGEMSANLMAQGFNTGMQGAIADRQGQLARDSLRLNAGGQQFQMGQGFQALGDDITAKQAGAGSYQEALLNQILQGGAGQYAAYAGGPMQMLNMINAVMAADPRGNVMTQTQKTTPGLFDYLSLGAGVYAAGL